jgi:hypothetical protein
MDNKILQTIDFFSARYNLDELPYVDYLDRITNILTGLSTTSGGNSNITIGVPEAPVNNLLHARINNSWQSFVIPQSFTQEEADNRFYPLNSNPAGYLIQGTGNNDVRTNSQLDARYALISHTHTINQIVGLQAILDNKENSFVKNTAFNRNFGTTIGTVAQGNDVRINNGQTAFSWGNHAGLYRPINYVPTWNEILNKPSTFTPSAHPLSSHNDVEITGLTINDILRFNGNRFVNVQDTPNHVKQITTAQINNWNTAFGWGNHINLYRPISYVPSWNEITNKPLTFNPTSHTHTWNQITGVPETASRFPSWSEITDKPTSFTPSSHTHTINQVLDLQNELNSKANLIHNHSTDQITSGTLSVIRGGTGRNTFISGEVLVGNGTNNINTISRQGIDTRESFPASPHAISSHNDVFIENVFAGQMLRYNGTVWVNWSPNFLTSFTETDPTVPSHVKSITTVQISNWNSSFSWGNHANAGYALTSQLHNILTLGNNTNGLVLNEETQSLQLNLATNSTSGAMSSEDKTKLDNLTQYVHPTGFSNQPATPLSGSTIISRILVNNEGHVTGITTRELTLQSVGATASAFTVVDDNNIKLALSGNSGTALLESIQLELTWEGQLPVARGGTGANNLALGQVLIGNGTSGVTTLSRSGIDSRSQFPASPHNLTSHTDVNISLPSTGQVLTYNGTTWVNQDLDLQEIGFTETDPVFTAFTNLSRNANTFYAGPVAVNGAATFRTINPNDIPNVYLRYDIQQTLTAAQSTRARLAINAQIAGNYETAFSKGNVISQLNNPIAITNGQSRLVGLSDLIISHNTSGWTNKSNLTGNTVISNITVDAFGHISNWTTREITAEDLGLSGLQNVSSDKNFVHLQNSPSSLWTINHGLNKKPSITIIDSAGSQVLAKITYVDNNNVTIDFNGIATSGEAIFN